MSREKYGMIWDCYHCRRGTESEIKECPNNAYNRNIKRCDWEVIVKNDVLKIATGNKMPTFPVLEEIVKAEGISHPLYIKGEKE